MKQYWYLVYSKPRQEQLAKQHLLNQNFDVVLPLFTKKNLKDGKVVNVTEPMFPRYLFVKPKNAEMSLSSVKYTKGVADFVRFGGQAATVPSSIVEHFNVEKHQTNESMFNVGDVVQINNGSFAGLSAVFQMPKAQDRCIVLLRWLGQQVPATLAYNQLTSFN